MDSVLTEPSQTDIPSLTRPDRPPLARSPVRGVTAPIDTSASDARSVNGGITGTTDTGRAGGKCDHAHGTTSSYSTRYTSRFVDTRPVVGHYRSIVITSS